VGPNDLQAAVRGLRHGFENDNRFRPDKLSFAIGTIEDAFAHTGCYLVRLPAGPMVPALDLVHCSGLPLGARPIGGYSPRSRVLILHSPMFDTAIVIGSVAKQLANAETILPDSIALRSCVGLIQDPMHYTTMLQSPAMGNFSLGRPMDSLPGDWGAINDFGAAFILGRALASIRASDLAKVEAFWGDDLLRVTGYNFEAFHAAAEKQRVDDEGEWNEIEFSTPFIWEGLGVRRPGIAVSRNSDDPVRAGNRFATVEPAEDDQHIIPRAVRLGGYLGDVERSWVCAPPDGIERERFSRVKPPYVGLSEILRGIDGTIGIRSAREIIIEKTIKIPVPKRLKSSEDPTGDNRTNYDAAGLNDDEISKTPFVWGSDEANVRAVQAIDQTLWSYGRYASAGLIRHEKDWYLPEEEDLSSVAGDGTFYSKPLNLGHRFLLPLGEFADIVIDHRYGNSVRYYRTRSGFRLHDDGSFTLEDGYGSQIKMTGGSIFLTAVNDIWLQPGRSLIGWAPFDVVMRAGNCADITAAKKAVRIKSEEDMQLLSGNGGTGRCLIENRAAGEEAGITLKAAESAVHAFAKEIYMGSVPGYPESIVTIDAGSGTLFLRGKDIVERILTNRVSLIVSETGPDKTAFFLNKTVGIVGSSLEIGGNLGVFPPDGVGGLEVGGSIKAHGGGLFGKSVATNGSFGQATGGNFVGKLAKAADMGSPPETKFAELEERVDLLGEIVDAVNSRVTESEDNSPGNPRFQRKIGAAMRSTEDLGLDETFVIPEARWQQILRSRDSGETWDEPEVIDPSGNPTRPHPGQAAWEEEEHYVSVDPANYDGKTGAAKSRAEMSEKGNPPVAATLKDGYLINVQE